MSRESHCFLKSNNCLQRANRLKLIIYHDFTLLPFSTAVVMGKVSNGQAPPSPLEKWLYSTPTPCQEIFYYETVPPQSSLSVDFHRCICFFSFEHVKFTCINEIQVMYGRPRLKVKVQRGSFTFKRDLPYITSISFTRVKITQHVANAIPVLEKRNFYIEKTLSSYQNTRQSWERINKKL